MNNVYILGSMRLGDDDEEVALYNNVSRNLADCD